MNQISSVLQPAEAGPDRAVTVHCLAGSSFELEVNSAETAREVAERIAAEVGHPAFLLVLTSGNCFIDQCQLLLHQVQHDEISYVVRKFGAGRVAMLWESLLEEKTLFDVAALNKTMSLTWLSNTAQPGHPTAQQPAEFVVWRRIRPKLGGHPTTQQPAEFDVWQRLRPEVGGHPTTQQPAEFDVWRQVQPELGGHPTTQQPAEFDVWRRLRPELGGRPTTSSLQSLTFGKEFNQSLEGIQLPSSLQSLTFGDDFDQRLEGIQLPSSLQSLTFGAMFNQSLEQPAKFDIWQ